MANKRITDVDSIELLNGDESFFVNQNNAIKQINKKDIIVGISNGGTGSSTVAGARNALGLGNTDGALPIANGGTGANSAEKARLNLGIGATLYVNAPAGINVTISKDKTSYSKAADSNGLAIFKSLDVGTWTIRIADGDRVATQTLNVEPDYSATIAFFAATISVTYPSGSTCTCSDGKTTLKAPNTTGTWKCVVPNTGTWTVKITDGSRSTSTNVSITANGQSKSATLAYFAATISVTYPSGSTCTCSDGKTTLTAPNTTGSYSFTIPNTGTWTVSCTNGTKSTSSSVSITSSGQTQKVTLAYFAATISVTYPAGSTCTCSDGKTTLKAPNTTGTWKCVVPNVGTWTVSCTDGNDTAEKFVSITTEGQSESIVLSYNFVIVDNGTEVMEASCTQYVTKTQNDGYVSYKSGGSGVHSVGITTDIADYNYVTVKGELVEMASVAGLGIWSIDTALPSYNNATAIVSTSGAEATLDIGTYSGEFIVGLCWMAGHEYKITDWYLE